MSAILEKVYCNDCKFFKYAQVHEMEGRFVKEMRCTDNDDPEIVHKPDRIYHRLRYDDYQKKNKNNDCSAFEPQAPKIIGLLVVMGYFFYPWFR